MTPSEEEILKAWIESEKRKYVLLSECYKNPTMDMAQVGFFSHLLDAQITPYYHFKIDYIERQENQLFHAEREKSGRESGSVKMAEGSARKEEGPKPAQSPSHVAAANPASSPPKCTKCEKEFTPRTFGAKLCIDCWKKERRR